MTTRTTSVADVSDSWTGDTELVGYQRRTIGLPDAARYAGEPKDALAATLVRHRAPVSLRAVLYVHGWSDYFFQDHLAQELEALGYDFYALDLRRYGRSLRTGQLAGFITDLTHYYTELDAAVDITKGEGHDHLVLMGHSTGGLLASLWANDRPGALAALVLNSPWLELQGNAALRPALQPMFKAVGSLSPTYAFPVSDAGFNRRLLWDQEDGQWSFNTNLKGDRAFAVRVGWLAAIMSGQGRVAEGLGIDVPVLMLISARTDFRQSYTEELRRADVVLDVERLAERAPDLGRHVTLIRIDGGMHDLALSDEPARASFFDEMARWLRTYG
ncbi:MAG: alpha/beta hydrolase [Arachnia sp.]